MFKTPSSPEKEEQRDLGTGTYDAGLKLHVTVTHLAWKEISRIMLLLN